MVPPIQIVLELRLDARLKSDEVQPRLPLVVPRNSRDDVGLKEIVGAAIEELRAADHVLLALASSAHEGVVGRGVEDVGGVDVVRREVLGSLAVSRGPANGSAEGGDGHAERYVLVVIPVVELFVCHARPRLTEHEK